MEKLYEIGSSSDETYIFAKAFRHPFTLELSLKLAEELVRHGEKLNVHGCLIDIRGTTSVSSVLDKYEFANEKAKAAGLPRHWRLAFLVDRGDTSPDFIETFMKNAGYIFQIFKDERKAIDWLKEAQSR